MKKIAALIIGLTIAFGITACATQGQKENAVIYKAQVSP
jgi:hypothetical protein